MKYLVLTLVVVLCGCPKKQAPILEPASVAAPKRVILFIGDGMGVGAITAATYAKGDWLEMTALPEFGFVTTHEHEFVTTDSAASATALATGHKTHFNGISVKPGTTEQNEHDPGQHLETWFEIAKKRGLGTGLVTTSRVNHATPAAFVTHRKTRKSYEQIAEDIATFAPDVLFGSGSKYFNQRKDGKDLIKEMTDAGYTFVDDAPSFQTAQKTAQKLVALFYEADTPFLTEGSRKVGLPDMFDGAVSMLDRTHPDGWVLMVEGSFIDWCAHSLDAKCLIAETLEFDQTIGRGTAYAKGREDTLIVVTADHETGGLSVIDPEYASRFVTALGGPEATKERAALPKKEGKQQPWPDPVQHFDVGPGSIRKQLPKVEDVRFTTVFGQLSVASAPFWKTDGRFYAAHSAEAVPLWASGPHAKWIASSRDNAEVGAKLKTLVGGAARAIEKTKPERAKNLIIMLGDGMGLPIVSATQYRDGALEMFTFPVHGLNSTHTGDKLVADSAATATAISTGHRSGRHRVGVDLDGKPHVTIMEAFTKNGGSAGVVTTTEVTHGTPAAFYAHVESRREMPEIVDDLISYKSRTGQPLDVLFGGGAIYFEGIDDRLAEAGITLAKTWPPTQADGPIVGTFAERGLETANVRHNDQDPSTPTLAEMTKEALRRLSKNERGFVLMVEGGQIDWRLHELDQEGTALDEVKDFDEAVTVARKFADKHGSTTIVVTADHDHTVSVIDNHYAFESGRCGAATICGGPDLFMPIAVAATAGFQQGGLQGEFSPPVIHLQYAWLVKEGAKVQKLSGPHSARFVPLFAYGPQADLFTGFMDQPELGRLIHTFVPAQTVY